MDWVANLERHHGTDDGLALREHASKEIILAHRPRSSGQQENAG
jgi:hypothetical protein